MKIGIITLPLNTNYGGILQAYALRTLLQRLGHEVYILESKRPPFHSKWVLPLVWIKRFIYKYLFHQNVEVFKHPNERIRQYTDVFIKKYINILQFENWNSELLKDFDCFIVGSDQIWRPCYVSCLNHAFLDFTTNLNVRRIAYAVSFGTDKQEYTIDQIKTCKALVERFLAVSVREDTGVDLCKSYFNVLATHVLDPTMLLTVSDYLYLFKSKAIPKSKGDLFVYILDENPEEKQFISEFATKFKLSPFHTNAKVHQYDAPIAERIQPPLEFWLRGIYDAKFVITDSFHACVFSILFHKPFLVIGNVSRGLSRVESLLKLFKLEDCLITTLDRVPPISINWTEVDEILELNREKSKKFLVQNLKKNHI